MQPGWPRSSFGLLKGTQSRCGLILREQSILGRKQRLKRRIKLLLVDDHPIVRHGISNCLAQQEHITIVGEASDGVEAIRKANELLPDMILMDIEMPLMNGFAATELLRLELPNVKVLILSMHRNSNYVLRIIQSGARGYVLKEASLEELMHAIETVNSDKTFFSPKVSSIALNQSVGRSGNRPNLAQLTSREREVLTHLAEGLTNKEVASAIGVGIRTVESHRESIMSKLNIHTVPGLIKFAISEGLIIVREEKH